MNNNINLRNEASAEKMTQGAERMTIEKMMNVYPPFQLCWTEIIADGEMTEEEMIHDIAEQIADVRLGNQFESEYNSDLEQLPLDMRNALAQDAQNMLEEMKNDSLLLDFENARAKGHFSRQMPSRAVWEQERPSGEKLIKTYSSINGLYSEIEIDSTGFTKRKFLHSSDGSYLTYLYDKNDKDNVQVISGTHSDKKAEENKQ